MSISNLIVGETFFCDGVVVDFPITFDFTSVDQIDVYVIEIATGISTSLTITTDYTLTPDEENPTYVKLNTAPSALYYVRIQRQSALQQTTEYVNNSKFLADDHETALDKIVLMVQELALKLAHTIQAPMVNYGLVNPVLPKLLPGYIVVTNAFGTGFDLLQIPTNGVGGALPDGGDQYSLLEKSSSDAGDADWTAPIEYDGYSARFAQTVSLAGIKAAMDFLINIQYTAPLISLSGSSNTLREKGTSVSGITLTASVTKKSDPIQTVRFYQGVTLLDTQTSGGAVPSGGNSTYVYAPSFSDNISFSAQVDDNGATGGPTTVTANTSYAFVYPYYVGAGAAGLSGASIAGLTKLVITQNNNHTYTLTVGSGQYTYYAFPAGYGDLTSILDVNGFEVLPSWTKRTVSITGLDASSQSYTVYEGNNPLVAGSYQFTFKR